jgi:hypothetical protein
MVLAGLSTALGVPEFEPLLGGRLRLPGETPGAVLGRDFRGDR